MLLKFASFLFFVTLSFNAAFAIGPYLRLYVISSLLFFCATVIHAARKENMSVSAFMPEDSILVAFFVIACVLTAFVSNEKSLNYLAVYFYVFILLVFSLKIAASHLGTEYLLHANYYGVLITSLFVVLDFSLYHTAGFDLQSYVFRYGPDPQATVAGRFRRSYGFSNEPTNLSAYLNTLGFLGIYYAYNNKLKWRLTFAALVVFAFISSFSAGGIASVLAGILLTLPFLVLRGFYRLYLPIRRTISTLAVSGFSLWLLFDVIGTALDSVIRKMLFMDANFGSGRGELWTSKLDLVVNETLMVGRGLGSISSAGESVINSYLLFAVELGLFGTFLLVLYIFLTFARSLACSFKCKVSFVFPFVIIVGATNLAAFSTFYYPFLWVSLVLAASVASQRAIGSQALNHAQ